MSEVSPAPEDQPPAVETPHRRSAKDCSTWADLTPNEQAAASQLEYNERLWDAGAAPKVCNLRWLELAGFEQAAATILGYGETSWNQEIDSHAMAAAQQTGPSPRRVTSVDHLRSLICEYLGTVSSVPLGQLETNLKRHYASSFEEWPKSLTAFTGREKLREFVEECEELAITPWIDSPNVGEKQVKLAAQGWQMVQTRKNASLKSLRSASSASAESQAAPLKLAHRLAAFVKQQPGGRIRIEGPKLGEFYATITPAETALIRGAFSPDGSTKGVRAFVARYQAQCHLLIEGQVGSPGVPGNMEIVYGRRAGAPSGERTLPPPPLQRPAPVTAPPFELIGGTHSEIPPALPEAPGMDALRLWLQETVKLHSTDAAVCAQALFFDGCRCADDIGLLVEACELSDAIPKVMKIKIARAWSHAA